MSERAAKPLEIIWSKRALRDLDKIEEHYLEESGERLADEAVDTIYWQAERVAGLRLKFRPGENDTRECVLKQFPYTMVYRINSARVTAVPAPLLLQPLTRHPHQRQPHLRLER